LHINVAFGIAFGTHLPSVDIGVRLVECEARDYFTFAITFNPAYMFTSLPTAFGIRLLRHLLRHWTQRFVT
jgi:hypothetical protein